MGVWLLGDQLHWIFSVYSTNVLRHLLLLKSLSHRSICYMETWNAVATKMKCYSGNTYVIPWAESPLQWNGCCLATNAKEEPEESSIFFAFPPCRRSTKHLASCWWCHCTVFMETEYEDDNQVIILVNATWTWYASQWWIPTLFIVMNNREVQVSKMNRTEVLRTLFPKSSARRQGTEVKGTWDFKSKT